MFRRFGGDATYIVANTNTFDPATGENIPEDIERPVRVILQDFETTTSRGLVTREGTTIVQGDKQAYILPPEQITLGDTPLIVSTVSGRLRVGDITYKVKSFKEANPTGANVLLYELHLGR